MTAGGKDGSERVPVLDAGTTLQSALLAVTRVLSDAGIADAMMDARFLLQGVLELDAAAFLSQPERALGERVEAITAAVRRRLMGEPVSRILGVRAFYGRDFLITPDVLDPRPDTETLIEVVLETVRRSGRDGEPLTIADIGSGSGAIIVTLLLELPKAIGIATDVSAATLEVTLENAKRLGVGDRLRGVVTRGLKGVNGPFDIVVSNPPYIPSRDIASLAPGVRDFDPRVALDGGADGLDFYREIFHEISLLSPSPQVFVEVGAGQAKDVEELLGEAGLRATGRWRDLGGQERVVAAEIHR